MRSPSPLTVVRTPLFDTLASVAPIAFDRAEIVVLDGPHGTGKTTTTTWWAREWSRSAAHELEIAPSLSCQQFVRHLHGTVHGGTEREDLAERDLQDDLVQTFETPMVIILHGTHRLSTAAAAQLEWLYSQRNNAATFILEGGPNTARVIARDAALRGRIAHTITARPLDAEACTRIVPQLHPLLAGAASSLIQSIDEQLCHGLLSHWTRFAHCVIDVNKLVTETGRPAPGLTPAVAKNAYQRMPTTMTRR